MLFLISQAAGPSGQLGWSRLLRLCRTLIRAQSVEPHKQVSPGRLQVREACSSQWPPGRTGLQGEGRRLASIICWGE